LAFLDASPNFYDWVWTSNATGAIKIIAEGYPYQAGQKLVISADSHSEYLMGHENFAKYLLQSISLVILFPCKIAINPRQCVFLHWIKAKSTFPKTCPVRNSTEKYSTAS
jgi:hypothetical protein